jgi:uncharacterized membrane protein SpoIIM required for sporulation
VTPFLLMRIKSMRPSFCAVALFYCLALIIVVGCGATIEFGWGHDIEASQFMPVEVSPSEAFRVIARENGRLWLYMCAGMASFGAAGFAVLLGNGLRFGLDAMALARGAPDELRFLIPHASIEFLAFTLAALPVST